MTDPFSGETDPTKPFSPTKVLPLPDQRRKYWIFGVGGCGVLLCIAALLVSSFILYRQSSADALAGTEGSVQTGVAVNIATKALPTVAKQTATNPASKTPTTGAAGTAESAAKNEPTPVTEPVFGPICFQSVTIDGEISSCSTTFPPTVVEIHAIFDYTGMTPHQHRWTRRWFHNGQQVLNVEDAWTGDKAGQFDYNLNTTDGEPLSPGTWELELYTDGDLQTFGAFVISPPETPTDTAPRPAAPAIAKNYMLAFTKWDGSKHSIWVSDLNGNNQRFLLDFAASPSWSPDGTQIAFYGEEGIDTQGAVESGANGLWLMGANGELPRQILADGSVRSLNWAWSADLIAFDAARGGSANWQIYFADSGGSEQPLGVMGEQPAISPDGGLVVAKACRPDCGLWLSNTDDSNPTQLTFGSTDGLPAWSPDGSKIAFSRNVDGNVDIYVINIDGSGLRQLTTAPNNDSVPTWTPDGRHLAFRSTRNGLWQIFVMAADGGNQQLIIDNVGAGDEWAFDRMSIR